MPQEKADNQQEPEHKKKALKIIIDDYNKQYGTNHSISFFDAYYQDVQKRVKDHKYTNTDYPHKNKIDVLIVVDMLLTGFDSKYLNTLYVDKNLQYHGLIQAFSRTNRVLNDSKPYGNILDFRNQQTAVDEAISLFSGSKKDEHSKEIWLVDPAPAVIVKYEKAVEQLNKFMQAQGLDCLPEEINNLKGDQARAEFINRFKEIQKYKTQLEQYTDLSNKDIEQIEKLIPQDRYRSFRGMYLETAKQLKALQDKGDEGASDIIQQLDFEFVLFASAVIDYDYIMALIAKFTQQSTPTKESMTRTQLINLLSSSANLMDERDDIVDYISTLEIGKALNEDEIKQGYQAFKAQKNAAELNALAQKHEIGTEPLQAFVTQILNRMIFDAEQLTNLLAPLGLGWKARTQKELALMDELVPLLKKMAKGREISGLSVYEE